MTNKATSYRIPNWPLANDIAQQPVTTRDGMSKRLAAPEGEELPLNPCGCTQLRAVAFPVVEVLR